jgi:hypothetical protein
MFYAPELVFGGAKCFRSCFYVLCSRTRFRRYRGRWVPFSCFACPDSFSIVPRASGPVFHVLRSRTSFRRYRGRRILFSSFMLPDSFAAVSSASGPVFMFCAPRLVFGGTEGVGSRCHVLRSRTRFRRYRGRLVLFLCFAHPDSFSTITKGDGSHFYVLGSRTRFRR